MERKFGALSSSTDPEQLGNTVKGTILMFTGIILVVARYLNIPLTETEVVAAATQLGLMIGAVWMLYGLVMKAVVALQKKFNF